MTAQYTCACYVMTQNVCAHKVESWRPCGCWALLNISDLVPSVLLPFHTLHFRRLLSILYMFTCRNLAELLKQMFMLSFSEYCASRAVPNVSLSEYLNTIGSKLLPGVDIMWTGTYCPVALEGHFVT